MRRLPIRLLVVLAALAAGLIAVPVLAQQRSVTVERRDGVMTIATDGTVRVVETWRVRFEGGPYRFAFRSIPLNRVEAIDEWGVREGDQVYREGIVAQPGSFLLDSEDGERKITWYFTPTTDAVRTFELSYTLHGALRIYEDGDQLFWKFIESDRAYTIESAHVSVRLPAEFPSDQIRSLTYRNSVEESEGGRSVDGRTVEFDGGPFPGGDEWEIRAYFPHGVVTAGPPSWQAEDDARRARTPIFNLATIVLSLLSGIGGSVGLYLLWYRRGRDALARVAPAYLNAPPSDLPPAVVGTLIDESADMKDVTATLVDLARRGYLEIAEQPGGWLSSAEHIFVRGEADLRELRPYERRLFDRLFRGDEDEIRLSSLRNKFYTELPALHNGMYDEVVGAGFFSESPSKTRSRYILPAILALVLALIVAIAGSAMLSVDVPLFPLLGFTLVGLAIAAIVVSARMPRKTEAGATAAAQWIGFKRYLQDLDRYTDVAAAREKFERYLPYAIVFGIEKEWVRRFEQVDTPAPVWYYPYGSRPWHNSNNPEYGESRPSGGSGGGMPSLDSAASSGFRGLNAMSSGLVGMLNSTSATLGSSPSSSGSGGSGGGGGGGGGGGSSGFG